MKPKKHWVPLAKHILIGFLFLGSFISAATMVNAQLNSKVTVISPDNKENIKQMQNGLQKLGYYRGQQTGNLDKATKQAIQKFQKDNSIKPATGVINEKTLTAMFRQLKNPKKQNTQGENGRTGYREAINPPKITPYTPPSPNDPGNLDKMKAQQRQSGSYWMNIGKEYVAQGTPPECPNPLVMQPPVDFSLVTSLLYPGQQRSTGYKAHGGFRFDSSPSNNISVKIPFDANLIDGSRYIEAGEIQYLLTFQSPCGIMYRFDHLMTLTPKFQKIADGFPEAKIDDSRTTNVVPPVAVVTGEEVATAVGFSKTKNVAVDFGVYDLRKKNAASANADWVKQRESALAIHGICWFDLFPNQKQVLLGLPAGDQAMGKKSDYCQ